MSHVIHLSSANVVNEPQGPMQGKYSFLENTYGVRMPLGLLNLLLNCFDVLCISGSALLALRFSRVLSWLPLRCRRLRRGTLPSCIILLKGWRQLRWLQRWPPLRVSLEPQSWSVLAS
jgi:hypothetical protein